MKKHLSLLLSVIFLFSLASCSGTSDTSQTGSGETENTTEDTGADTQESTDSAQQAAQITAIDGSQITLQLGTIEQPGDGGQQPSGQSDGTGDSGSQQPPELPEGESGQQSTDGDSQQPPELPEGESGSSTDGSADDSDSGDDAAQQPGGEAPQGGSGQPGGFTAGDETITVDFSAVTVSLTTDGEMTEGTYEDLAVGDILLLEYDAENQLQSVTVQSMDGGMGGQPGGGFGGSGEVTQGDAATNIEEDGTYSDTAYTSTGDDENALRVTGATVTLDGITVDKSAGETSNTENGDFYGVNAALLATDGAQVTITNAVVTSSAQNGNGVFSYGEGTTVNISDSTITTTADNSGGIQTTGGGTTNASDLTVSTAGNSSAAIRSDRGGGTVNVTGGSYTSSGYNSPAVYSTADITVSDAQLTAENSEALVIEGQNSITLTNCTVSGNMSDTEGTSSDENVHNVMIYQSMSGDAEEGTSTFSMTGGTLTSQNGDLIYVTNTHCILTLSGVEIVNQETDGALLRVSGNSASHGWGTAGSNGAQVEFTADSQTLEGDIVVDSISTLNMTLTNGSEFTGTVNIEDNADGGTAVEDNAVIIVESGCTWTLTGDCTITSLDNQGTVNYNGYTITLADGTVLSA